MSRLSVARDQRLEKLNALQQLGYQTYPARSEKTVHHTQLTEQFAQFEGKDVTTAGRIISWRAHGKVSFADLADASGTIQVFIAEQFLQPSDVARQVLGHEHLHLLDVGDFVQVAGTVIKTRTGQISIQAHAVKLLTKTLRPLPDKWEGLSDPEIIFRRRYLDLAISPERRAMFERKAKFWRVTREFLDKHGFIEVETPVLEHVTGGADARPFTTHMNALDQTFYLRISTELFQKRLIGGGFEKVFTIGPNFRNEGLSDEHLPEYYQVEWYWAYADYRDNMKLVQALIRHEAQEVYDRTRFEKNGHHFDLADDWTEIDYTQIIQDRLGINIFTDTDAKMAQVLREQGVRLTGALNRSRLIDNLWKIIRKTIAGPAFLLNEPAFMSPLSKSQQDNPQLTERFHVVIAGSELGNGYSELNDPQDQLARFKDQQAQRDGGDDEAQMLDLDYVEMLEYGMPPTSGYGQSERVFWFLEGVTAREGTLFPQLKSKVEATTKEIYGMS
jgi:lysyl-tRNA synthetase class 2